MKKFLKVLKELAIVAPMALLCGMMMMFPVENDHYGFEHPGINENSALMIIVIGTIIFIYSGVLLLVRHKKRVNFILPYIACAIVIIRIHQIVITLLSYV